jgi:penicillin-binding protein 2
VTAIHDAETHAVIPVQPAETRDLGLKRSNIDVVHKALVGVTLEGTSARAFAGAGYVSGGKTGTAQAISMGKDQKYDARKLEEHQRDHALYITYAPADDPKIALALVVENAGFGAEHAAPIARRVLDYWLMGQYPNEDDLAAVSKGQAAAPIGKPRTVAEVPWPPVGR